MSGSPDQWSRFIVPIFLHGGIIHILLNFSFQLRTGIQMEQDFGWWRIAMIYMISGVCGFVFGAQYSPTTPSVGCSGALYGECPKSFLNNVPTSTVRYVSCTLNSYC